MACEEMQLFYAYLDAVEEAKKKAQPWECQVTVFPQDDEPIGERIPAAPVGAAQPAKATKKATKSAKSKKSDFSCDTPE
jgi:hypothetical protein